MGVELVAVDMVIVVNTIVVVVMVIVADVSEEIVGSIVVFVIATVK